LRLHAKGTRRLEDAVGQTLPGGPSLHLLALPVDQVPVELATASVNVHLGSPEPTGALPVVATNPESSDNKDGEVGGEEIRCGADATIAEGRDGSVEL
jgi:hypothetical protein